MIQRLASSLIRPLLVLISPSGRRQFHPTAECVEKRPSLLSRLTTDERIARFGSPATNDTIRAWRCKIDRSNYFAVSHEQGYHMVGLVELFGDKASGWQRPELALSVRRPRDTSAIRLHLLEIGLIAARERGARDVFVAFQLT